VGGSRAGDSRAAHAAESPIEERRIVSILFADLAGFTERSDRADPEDVRRTLRPFHTVAKEEIEHFGGTLDKFIGDAVMGVFGAPVAHEDDAERAVRAALSLQSRISVLNQEGAGPPLSVRAAVNTGEAVVTFAAGPQIGENVAGDVVNTASRLQSVAPAGGVLVGEATYRATRSAVEYRELDPVSLKGKADPLQVWVATAVLLPAGARESDEAAAPPLVGRDRERRMLRELYDRTVTERFGQLITVVGEPGIGKTRLVGDLRDVVVARGDAEWLRGRCLPYGEGVTFWALGEVVKASAGILESDAREVRAQKLAAAIRRVEPKPGEAEWLEIRLEPLVGLAAGGVATGAEAPRVEREESFAAWIRYLEADAERRPLVLAFEDLHWADDPMLDFIDHAADRLDDVPVLIVATARPELFDRRPVWGGGKRNATTISLAPLSEAEMAELLATLVVRWILPDDARRTVAGTAGGNPLYAREFVRMLSDRAASGEAGPGEAGTISVPDSIQSLIAARLDLLSGAERSLLQDAAVAGEIFWSGAIAAMAGRTEAEVLDGLADLHRRGLVERATSQSMEGQVEYRFTHGLIRDVAYRQIPRSGRADRHLAVAAWMEAAADDRPGDRAELVANHFLRALELVRAARSPAPDPSATEAATAAQGPGQIEDAARRALLAAAEYAGALDVGRAAAFLEQALRLTPPGHPDRPRLLLRWAATAWRADRISQEDAQAAYREAAAAFLNVGDRIGAGAALDRLAFQLGAQGETAKARQAIAQALELLESEPPSAALARSYVSMADTEMFAGHTLESLAWAEKALDLGDVPGTDEYTINALHIRGNARLELGEVNAGIEDLRTALRRSEELGSAISIVTSRDYLGEWLWITEGPAPSLELLEAGTELAERRGLMWHAMWSRAGTLWTLFDAGDWDRLIRESDDLLAWEERKGGTQVGAIALPFRARVFVHRGLVEEATALAHDYLPRAREIQDLQVVAPALVIAALSSSAGGESDAALRLIDEWDDKTRDAPAEYREALFPDAVRILLRFDGVGAAGRLLEDARGRTRRQANCVVSARALVAEAAGDQPTALQLFDDAAARWEDYGFVHERALGLIGAARCLDALDRREEAARRRDQAAPLLRSLGIPGERQGSG
jgi:class 3 adenylate cyclase/tetratricopeptide (TPR) repeat protein